MDYLCEFATMNEFGRLTCKVGENLPCKFQRYCSQKSKWENTKNFSSCLKRVSRLNKETEEVAAKEIKNKEEVTTTLKKVDNVQGGEIKNFSTQKYKIISICPYYIIVEDADGHGIRKNGSFPNLKIGDVIEL